VLQAVLAHFPETSSQATHDLLVPFSLTARSFSVLEVSTYDLIHGLRYRSLAEQGKILGRRRPLFEPSTKRRGFVL
jgi:hypothetical protein